MQTNVIIAMLFPVFLLLISRMTLDKVTYQAISTMVHLCHFSIWYSCLAKKSAVELWSVNGLKYLVIVVFLSATICPVVCELEANWNRTTLGIISQTTSQHYRIQRSILTAGDNSTDLFECTFHGKQMWCGNRFIDDKNTKKQKWAYFILIVTRKSNRKLLFPVSLARP